MHEVINSIYVLKEQFIPCLKGRRLGKI